MLGFSQAPAVHYLGLSSNQAMAIDQNDLDFQEAASELSTPLLRYLTRYTGDPTVAEDLLQETLKKMYKGIDSFAGRSSLKTWAFSIASRVAADYFRHPDRRRKIVELSEECAPTDPDQIQDDRLVIDEMNECIRGIVDSLPDEYRSALILRDFEGLPLKQIAEISDCTLATAKIRVHRARQKLREAMTNQCDFYHNTEGNICCDRKKD